MIDYEDDVKRVKSTLKDIVGDIDTTTRDVKFLKADLNRIINKTRKVCPTPMKQQESVDFLGKLIEGVERIIQHENIYINRVIPYL
jgi:predicted AlkP superfamily phosphohydrolase/phosphomutase